LETGSHEVPLNLQTALQWTLQYNPTLIATRQNAAVSVEALAVARQFPTSLNPSVSVTLQPWVFARDSKGAVEQLQTLVSVTWSQPIELGGRTAYRTAIAQASYDQTRWNILQVELSTLVETYRTHQTAVYRQGKLRVAAELLAFNRRLVEVLRRQMEANQATAADVLVAEVESQSTAEQFQAARREAMATTTKLRQQIGVPEYAALAEAGGDLVLPQFDLAAGEEALIASALACRPEIQSAAAQVAGSRAAVSLAQADRIPIFSIGPAYEKDESGSCFYGMTVTTPVPILNSGRRLVAQREAEHSRDHVGLDQAQRRTITEVRAAVAQWKVAQDSVAQTIQRLTPIQAQMARMERLYQAGQTDLLRLLLVRQRAMEAENARLDALWQSTQAYADLLAAVGVSPLIGSVPPTSPGQP
jgi:cobalt-zinc-cadmium efflux system outer membrane protein